MNSFYAMQHANGKWFSVKDKENICVPVFRSSSVAMKARGRNRGMMFYKPTVFDEQALRTLLSGNSINFCFWLVSNPKTDVRHGQALTPEEFADQIKKESSDVQDSGLLSVM